MYPEGNLYKYQLYRTHQEDLWDLKDSALVIEKSNVG